MSRLELAAIQERQTLCRLCPRLVTWRESVAAAPPARYRGEAYWARPVPSFGDPEARVLIVGLAPAAHGGNRTGRVFTGDRSGDWLFRALWKAGFANQPTSVGLADGLKLHDCLVTAACHCAPPDNKPSPAELGQCRPFLLEEMRALSGMRVLIGLGKIGFQAAYEAARACGLTAVPRCPTFAHGASSELSATLTLIGSYHPSQQNTFTGRLTEPMFDQVFEVARAKLNSG